MEGVDKKCRIILKNDYEDVIETMIPEDLIVEYTTKMLMPDITAICIRRINGTHVTMRTEDIARIEVE